MTAPDPFADLQPTEAELAEVRQAISEAEFEEWLAEQDDGEPDDLANEYGLAEVGELVDLAHVTEQQRQAEDARPPLRRATGTSPTEDRLALGMRRAAAGTLTPQGMFAPAAAADALGEFTGRACGPYDAGSGRCSARFHQAGCLEVARSEAAAGSYDAVLAWRRQLNSGAPAAGAKLLASTDYGDLLDEAAGIPGPADPATLAAVRRSLGLAAGQPPRPAAGSSSLAAELGLR